MAFRGSTVKGGRGYLLIDNRASGGALEEHDTYTCGHCGLVVVMNKWRKRDRHICRRCRYIICDKPGCLADTNCLPEMLDLAMDRPTQPWLDRHPDGTPAFDTSVRDATRIH